VQAAEFRGTATFGASDDLVGQGVLFAAASEAAIGEELFAAGAYLGKGAWHAASLGAQDILRWLIILSILSGIVARLLGLLP
jgi:hypothetical protein